MTMAFERIPVTVLNADASVLHRKQFKEVLKRLLEGTYYVVESHDPPIIARSETMELEIPHTVMLDRYIHRPQIVREVPSKSDILSRDGYLCQFAGCGAEGTTIDHVIPRSRGGGNTWTNLVAACQSCNHRKADRTPSQAGMKLIREPFRPRSRGVSRKRVA